MLALYTRSLRHNSSLASTAATTAVNISATGILGRVVFGESTSLQWWAGATSILLGSFFINRCVPGGRGLVERSGCMGWGILPPLCNALPAPSPAFLCSAQKKAAAAAGGPAEPAKEEEEEQEAAGRQPARRRRTRRD